MKPTVSLTLVSLFLFFALSCKKKDEDIITNSEGTIIKLPSIWVSSVSNDGIMSYNFRGGSVFYNNGILTAEIKAGLKGGMNIPGEGNDYLSFKNVETGGNLWKWDDQLTDFESIDIKFPYQNDKYFTYTLGPRNYGIDLSNGQTLWKKEDMGNYDLRPMGLGTSYFVMANADKIEDYATYGLFEGDIRTGKQQFIVFPPFQNTYKGQSKNIYRYGHVGLPFLQGSDTLLSIVYQETLIPGSVIYTSTDRVQCFLSLYNKTNKKWIYERVAFTEPGISEVLDGIPILDSGLIYHSINRAITCHEVLTGKLVWKQTFDGNFLLSGFIKAGNKILANNEGTYLFALDAQTGSRLWQVKSPGTCTRMQELNGVVYFVGGGDGLLYAVDADSGKVYWKIESPDRAKNRGAFFYNMCSVAPGINGKKGKVIVSSGLNAFCYEAVR